MEADFLHKINLEKLQEETGLSIQGISELADVSVQTVYRWAWEKSKQGNRPSFNTFVRLLQKGATTETLFGVKQKQPSFENKEFQEGARISQKPMTKEDVVALFKEMKANGEL